MTASPSVRDLWLAKAHGLEEDRRTLLRLLEMLGDTRCRLNGSAGGLVGSWVYRAVEKRIARELTALNERQNEYLAEMMAFEPARDADSGHLGGIAADVVFTRYLVTRQARALQGKQLPVVSVGLLVEVQRAAERWGVPLRVWIEGVLQAHLASGGNVRPTVLSRRIRALLRERPHTARELATRLGASRGEVSAALRHLGRGSKHGGRALAVCVGRQGSRVARWVSLEER